MEIKLENYSSKKLDPFQLFSKHYPETMGDRESFKLDRIDEEIIEAWNRSDE